MGVLPRFSSENELLPSVLVSTPHQSIAVARVQRMQNSSKDFPFNYSENTESSGVESLLQLFGSFHLLFGVIGVSKLSDFISACRHKEAAYYLSFSIYLLWYPTTS